MNRRDFLIRGIFTGLAAGAAVPFIPSLLPEEPKTYNATKVSICIGGQVVARTNEMTFEFMPDDQRMDIFVPVERPIYTAQFEMDMSDEDVEALKKMVLNA